MAKIHQEEAVLDQSDSLTGEDTWLGRERDIAHLVYRKAFDTVSHKNLIEKRINYGMDEQTVK